MTVGDERTGALVRKLTPADRNAKLSAGTMRPKAGEHVSLWRLPGRWAVWSMGHTTATRWLQPLDDEAQRIVAVAADPERRAEVQPVVGAYSAGAVEVKCAEVRPAWVIGGES